MVRNLFTQNEPAEVYKNFTSRVGKFSEEEVENDSEEIDSSAEEEEDSEELLLFL